MLYHLLYWWIFNSVMNTEQWAFQDLNMSFPTTTQGVKFWLGTTSHKQNTEVRAYLGQKCFTSILIFLILKRGKCDEIPIYIFISFLKDCALSSLSTVLVNLMSPCLYQISFTKGHRLKKTGYFIILCKKVGNSCFKT